MTFQFRPLAPICGIIVSFSKYVTSVVTDKRYERFKTVCPHLPVWPGTVVTRMHRIIQSTVEIVKGRMVRIRYIHCPHTKKNKAREFLA